MKRQGIRTFMFLPAAGGIILAQMCLTMGDPVPGVILLATMLPIAVISDPDIRIRNHWSRFDWMAIMVFSLLMVIVRCYRLDVFHNIGELSARFAGVSIDAIRGHIVFPCIRDHEFDESLTGILIAPIIRLVGRTWMDFKVVSVIMCVPAIFTGYILAFRMFGRTSAVMAAGLLCLSGYLQRVDPLVGMYRFNLIGLLMMLCILFVIELYSSEGKLRWGILLGVLSGMGWYVHSMGRLIVLFVVLSLGMILVQSSPPHRKRWFFIFALIIAISLIISLPMIGYIIKNPGYLYYKKRQIIGFHEQFPLSPTIVKQSVMATLLNFNYRADLQLYFSPAHPLLRLMTAAGVLGGAGVLIHSRRQMRMRFFMLGLMVCILPLCIVTPGPWRGLYFTPAVILLTILSGSWWGRLFMVMTRGNVTKSMVAALLFLTIIGFVRLPGFYQGKQAPPRADNQITRLYADLKNEPSVPHYFSDTLDQCVPGNAIFEFTKGAYFPAIGVLKQHPLRLVFAPGKAKFLTADDAPGHPFVIILDGKTDTVLRKNLKQMFPEAREVSLPVSGLSSLRIHFERENEISE